MSICINSLAAMGPGPKVKHAPNCIPLWATKAMEDIKSHSSPRPRKACCQTTGPTSLGERRTTRRTAGSVHLFYFVSFFFLCPFVCIVYFGTSGKNRFPYYSFLFLCSASSKPVMGYLCVSVTDRRATCVRGGGGVGDEGKRLRICSSKNGWRDRLKDERGTGERTVIHNR